MSGFNEAAETMMRVFDKKNVENAQAIQRVRELHKPIKDPLGLTVCSECSRIATDGLENPAFVLFEYCTTRQALDGEQE